MAHTGSIYAPNEALGNCVPSLATMKASKDARRPQGYPAGAAAAPARAARRRTPSAWLRPAARAQQGEGLHSAAVGRVRRRLVLRAPVPRGQRLRRTRPLRLRHGAGSTRGTCSSTARCAGSIDSESTLQRMLPKEFILILSISKLITG